MSEAPTQTAPEQVHHQFDDPVQQRVSYTLGMWLFLATEVLFFGGMFTLYASYYIHYTHAFHTASSRLDIVLGGINTAVLLTSSLTMALSVASVEAGRRQTALLLMLATMVLGTIFVAIKMLEYHHKFEEHLWPGGGGADFVFPDPDRLHAQLFFALYFTLTAIHALHMLIGIAVVGLMAVLVAKGHYGPHYSEPVEMTGLYWHFVDIVWIFLFPLLYLIGRS